LNDPQLRKPQRSYGYASVFAQSDRPNLTPNLDAKMGTYSCANPYLKESVDESCWPTEELLTTIFDISEDYGLSYPISPLEEYSDDISNKITLTEAYVQFPLENGEFTVERKICPASFRVAKPHHSHEAQVHP